jgi:post-segregation antitoxin (ccd killing protein)
MTGSTKIRARIGIDRDLYEKAKELGLDFSKLLEYSIRRVVEALEGAYSENGANKWTERDLNPRLPACEAGVHTTELSALPR